MNIPFVDLRAQYLSIKTEIDHAIEEVITQTSFIGGPAVKAFERTFANMLGVKHCIGVGNGTDAIYVALKMLGVKEGDEVITSALSWISTSETISQAGAKPVFVDIDPATFTIDIKKIEAKITSKTRAIIPVHIYGQAAHIGEIKRICDKHKLYLIEDCAQSHLTRENGQLVGTFGHAATFSFYPGKNLGAYGDAGAILCNDDALATKMRMYANHGALKKHHHDMEGINSRLDTIQAAILDVKAGHLQQWTDRRIEHARMYSEFLSVIAGVIAPTTRANTTHSYHLYVIRTKHRDELKAHLESMGVQTAVHYPTALPNLNAYRYLGHQPSDFPVASAVTNEILSLPMFPELTEGQIKYVCDCIATYFKNRS